MTASRTVRAIAPAKINLWLDVLGRRPDGYHEIRTWMLAVDLSDRIEARANDRGAMALEVRGEVGPDIPLGRSNLAWRGAEAALRFGIERGLVEPSRGIDLVLEKQVPSQAGLGGGSSDAAAAWVATAATLGIVPEPGATRSALSALGSDCAFFSEAAATGAGLCEGRGERVRATPAPTSKWWIALVSPQIACPTAEVYAALARGRQASTPVPEFPERWFEMPASRVRPFLFNRLEPAALEAYPRLAAWREVLDASGAQAWRLSGSGSSFFGLFDERGEAEESVERVRRALGSSGIPIRGLWITKPLGHGARNLELV